MYENLNWQTREISRIRSSHQQTNKQTIIFFSSDATGRTDTQNVGLKCGSCQSNYWHRNVSARLHNNWHHAIRGKFQNLSPLSDAPAPRHSILSQLARTVANRSTEKSIRNYGNSPKNIKNRRYREETETTSGSGLIEKKHWFCKHEALNLRL